ncbi:MAG TPA: methylenetetrahydrofolate reductase [Gammaproteobacteria bacterium]
MTSGLKKRIDAREFVLTAEIVPALSASGEHLLGEAALLGSRVDAINVTDAASGRTSMSSFAAAAILAANGYEPILQVTCRDRNRIALAGDLLGAAAHGVRNLLILRGDDPRGGDQPDAKPVYDLDSRELMALARDMRDKGVLPSGRKIDPPPDFFIGGADVPRDPGPDWNPAGLLGKADAGAGFVQTQFCFDLGVARRYIGRLHEEGITERVGIIVGVGPIRSAKSARWMNENLFGVHVPESVIERLERAADAAEEGRAICAELIEGLREIPGVAGAHVMAPGGGTSAIAAVLDQVSERTRRA